MFRQEETFVGGWQEKTLEAMQRRRFKNMTAQLPPFGAGKLDALNPEEFSRRIEQSWQGISRKPIRAQQLSSVWQTVLSSVEMQADYLSPDEHELVERALILGGSIRLENVQEIEAARALSLRLWAHVGLMDGRPYMELEAPVFQPAADAISRQAHAQVRIRLEDFDRRLNRMLYLMGGVDDRYPQQMLVKEMFVASADEESIQLARRYLWSSCDCVDYSGGVMLVHRALADPRCLLPDCGRRRSLVLPKDGGSAGRGDILEEEIPLQQRLERLIAGALREGNREQEVSGSIRMLCKQGAPLSALEEVLQSKLIVLASPHMRDALLEMYTRIPKWVECMEPQHNGLKIQ